METHLPTEKDKDGPRADPKTRAQESLDVGVWAALDLCRQARMAGKTYNPFLAFEEKIILLALRATKGNQLQAAKLLHISRSTLRKRMKKHHIQINTRIIEGL